MRVLLINTSERIGGAAVAASRLMEALKAQGIKAKLLVRDKQTGQSTVVPLKRNWRLVWKFVWERIVIWTANRFSKQNIFAVDIANTGTDITSLPEFQQADVIHLHWVNQGMLSLKNIEKILATGKPVVWTMHDMWPCTGICHHARTCDRYAQECHNCPFIAGGNKRRDLSYRIFHRKLSLYTGHHIHFVTCSQWLGGQARQSALLQGQTVTSIPNPINTNLFRPHDSLGARTRCNLPQDLKLILFGSVKITDKRKGIDYLVKSCRLLAERHPELKDRLGVVAFGKNSEQLAGMLPFKVYPLDFVSNEHQLVDIYNAVDLFATPSLEENLPNTIMEAMACGVPCVGFNTGGIPEMIDHRQNGYVAAYKDAADLAEGMRWTLYEADYRELSRAAVSKVTTAYSQQSVAMRYIEIYNQALAYRHYRL